MRRPTFRAIPLALLAMLMTSLVFGQGQDGQRSRHADLREAVSDWRYPDAAMPSSGGGSGGNTTGWGEHYTAIMLTPDPIETVVKFYDAKILEVAPFRERLAKSLAGGPNHSFGGGDADSGVLIQADSQGRPLTLRVIQLHWPNTTTTLVISRAEGEKQTHIAWSHFASSGARREPPHP